LYPNAHQPYNKAIILVRRLHASISSPSAARRSKNTGLSIPHSFASTTQALPHKQASNSQSGVSPKRCWPLRINRCFQTGPRCPTAAQIPGGGSDRDIAMLPVSRHMSRDATFTSRRSSRLLTAPPASSPVFPPTFTLAGMFACPGSALHTKSGNTHQGGARSLRHFVPLRAPTETRPSETLRALGPTSAPFILVTGFVRPRTAKPKTMFALQQRVTFHFSFATMSFFLSVRGRRPNFMGLPFVIFMFFARSNGQRRWIKLQTK
jgi:hypothetical protein